MDKDYMLIETNDAFALSRFDYMPLVDNVYTRYFSKGDGCTLETVKSYCNNIRINFESVKILPPNKIAVAVNGTYIII